MRRRVSLTLAVLLGAGLLAGPLPAQERTPLSPSLGLALGLSRPPASIQDPCGGRESLPALDVRVGVERGGVSLEARGSGQVEIGAEDCVWAPLAHPDGIHTDLLYPFRRGAPLTTDLRVRYAPPLPGSLGLGAGGGWAWSHDLPYVVAATGVHAPGRVRLTGEVERTWFRVPSKAVTREWRDLRVVRELSRERRRDWQGGWGVRVGVDVGFR